MSGPPENERLWKIFRRAADMPPAASAGHIAEDDERLACWEADLLGPKERRELIEHLAACPSCRNRIAEMVKDGRLELAEAEFEAAEPASSLPPPIPSLRTPWWRSRQVYGIAMAASVLVCLAGVVWYYSPTGPDRVLALADRELRAGRPDAALRGIEPLLARPLPPELANRAKGLFGEAGYQAAAKELTREHFKGVLDLEDRVSRRSGPSGRLLNLKLQAERGISAELALNKVGTLTDYGYELDGSAPRKALPTLDQTTDRLEKEYKRALTAHPQDVALLLNRGQFLLTQARYEEAKQCFAQASQLSPDNPAAEIGLGLVAFERNQADEALQHFRTALRLDPTNVAARVNIGICLYGAGQAAEARKQWEQACELTTDTGLRERLQAELKNR